MRLLSVVFQRLTFVCVVSVLFSAPVLATNEQAADAPIPDSIEFNRDVRPILSDNCFFCHGPDKNKREANLRLDTFDGLVSTNDHDAAIVPGKPNESELIRRIMSTDDDELMPPAESGKLLSQRDRELLRRWIQQGGEFQGHWSFLPIEVALQGDSASPTHNVIDSHIAESLNEIGLAQSPEADRITLIRRLSFDLIGLPPTAEEVDRFVSDTSLGAYERLVDRLLSSPHFGERLAIWWLDLVRYADTVGYHGDQPMSVSPFRQYIIDSFNANKPFDQLTIEHLAGDLLPNPTREQLIGSGYNRLGMMSAEGGVQDKEYLAKYIAERVRNATGTWMGITLGCAECHDHKFDPLTTKDFYRFEAFFADIKERGLYAGANHDGSWGPSIKVPTDAQAAELAKLDDQITAVKKTLETDTPELATAQAEWENTRIQWTEIHPATFVSKQGTKLASRSDGAILASDKNPDTDTYSLTFDSLPPSITALRLEVLPDDSLPSKGGGRASNGNFVLTELIVKLKDAAGSETPIALQNASASYEQTGFVDGNPYRKWAVAAAIDGDAKGVKWGWGILEQVGKPHFAIFETTSDLTVPEGSTLTIEMAQNLDNPGHNIGCFCWSIATSPRPINAADAVPENIQAILAISVNQRSDEQKSELARHYRTIAPLLASVREQLANLEKQRNEFNDTIPSTLITETVTPRMVRVLARGNWMDETGEAVTPAFPEVLAPAPPADKNLNRLDLAHWMTSADNPLTPRVIVNRLWKLYFGSGLSRRLDDLGAQGEWPSHPKLLDFLADDFRSHGWDLKRTIKSIVMTQTYRQSSLTSPTLREIDPYNRWLARQSRFRLDAELVRDNALAVSGLLVSKIGGVSVNPYQPAGYWAYLNFPAREWQNSSGDDLYRRGLYTHWQRQYLHPSLAAFDAPSREECTADRPRSNTPLQSLVLLNDPTYVEAARVFAEVVVRKGGETTRERLDFAFRRALSRKATDQEAVVLEKLLDKHLADFLANESAASEFVTVGAKPAATDIPAHELAAWTSVARTILNLHETITRN